MEWIFDVLKWLVYGFLGLLGLLIVAALIFGKRIRKQWEFEAEFRDPDGREFGEFEIELSRIEKEEADYTVKTKFRMRHSSLTEHATVRVYIDDLLVFEDTVRKAGRLVVLRAKPVNRIDDVAAGQLCRVVVGSTEVAAAELRPD